MSVVGASLVDARAGGRGYVFTGVVKRRPYMRVRIGMMCVLQVWTTVAASAAETVHLSGRAMGTTWAATFVQPATVIDPAVVARRVAQRLEDLEQIFSTFRPNSELSRFNATTSTEWFAVSVELARVADESRRISERTGGAFDGTVHPLVQLWGFGAQRRTGGLPTDQEITAARRDVDWRQLEARTGPPALRKRSPGVSADFSSMAKGFAVDAVGELLHSLGVKDFFVQVGGDLKTSGHAASGDVWRAGIEQPGAQPGGLELFIGLSGRALSTSGDNRNYRTVEGRRYGHIIDPRTGRPTASALGSVSVVARSCATSSALATGLFVLGPQDGYQLAVREGLAALFIVREGDKFVQRMTPEFERILWRAKGDTPW